MWIRMSSNDAFSMGGHTADRLGYDLAHRVGNQIAAMECEQAAQERRIEELYEYVKARCDQGLPVLESQLGTLERAGYIVHRKSR